MKRAKKKALNLGGRPRLTDLPNGFDVLVGGRVKDRRRAAKLTQSAVAEKLGKSLAQVCRYESGDTSIDTPTLARLAEILGCKASDFLDGIKAEKVL